MIIIWFLILFVYVFAIYGSAAINHLRDRSNSKKSDHTNPYKDFWD